MNHAPKADGEQEYWQDFDVEEGEYQYKFRLGPGDWWVLDETKDIGISQHDCQQLGIFRLIRLQLMTVLATATTSSSSRPHLPKT